MKDAILTIICSVIIGVFLSGKVNVEYASAKLINETYSRDGKGCQIFREWTLNDRRIACCTDKRSSPVTLCVNEYGQEINEIKKIQFSVWY
jgi:hypothetical protein